MGYFLIFVYIQRRPIFNSCFLYQLIDESFHNKHEEALQQFTSKMREKTRVNDVKLVGYVKEAYSALAEEYVKDLLMHCKSVGIIMGKHADGRQRRSGTVFRVGSHFVLTNLHVVQSIAGQ